MTNRIITMLLGGAFLLVSCESHYQAELNEAPVNVNAHLSLPVTDSFISEQDCEELLNLQAKIALINDQYGVVVNRSGGINWPRFWAVAGSDAVGAVVFGLISGNWWGILGGAVACSVGSYATGVDLDQLTGIGTNPPSSNPSSGHILPVSSFVGYDDNGQQLYYDQIEFGEIGETIDMQEEIRENIGILHNQAIISLYQEYGDSLCLCSHSTIIDQTIERVASWYGLESWEVPHFFFLNDYFEDAIVDEDEDFVELAETYTAYADLFPVVKSYIVAIVQLETGAQIIAYQGQVTNLIQSSSLSEACKETLLSGLDVMVSSNGLWVVDDELIEEEGEELNF